METLLAALRRNNIGAQVVEGKEEALQLALRFLPSAGTIAFAGSETVKEIGLREYLLKENIGCTLIDPYEPGISSEEAYQRRRRALLADVLITGTNAITMNGELVNLDSQGNRVAGLAFGPRKVIVVVGTNKIVKHLAAARARIATVAAPLNSRRLKRGNPCEETGKCENCRRDSRICRIYSVINGQTVAGRIEVIIVKEKLGY